MEGQLSTGPTPSSLIKLRNMTFGNHNSRYKLSQKQLTNMDTLFIVLPFMRNSNTNIFSLTQKGEQNYFGISA